MAELSVLLVEDNEQNLELAQFLLEEAGVAVAVARDADAARAAWGQPGLGCVLMDMDLGGTDGLTLVRELRAQPATATLPVIALTAHAMRGDRERFLACGCSGYIAKPIQPRLFVDEVRKITAAAGGGAR